MKFFYLIIGLIVLVFGAKTKDSNLLIIALFCVTMAELQTVREEIRELNNKEE